MWIKNNKTQEYIPVNEHQTKKVFLDGQNGWCVLQNSGERIHISEDQLQALQKELDPQSPEQ